MTNQIWCEKGHYHLDESDQLWTARVTEVGQPCLVKGCDAKIVIRQPVYGKYEKGFIVPRLTDAPDTIGKSVLLEKARLLREEADILERQVGSLKLYAIPDVATEQTEIDSEKWIDWYVKGGEAPRVPLSDT